MERFVKRRRSKIGRTRNDCGLDWQWEFVEKKKMGRHFHIKAKLILDARHSPIAATSAPPRRPDVELS